ncbi:hypothetical protein [Sphingobium sp.]|uniref:hypothetical protein n=1 Tax=Sphingobium sp. TaxID=1912891 RepID=UPI0028BE7907|nr:hypothetical protein [Sphingobium sp.]
MEMGAKGHQGREGAVPADKFDELVGAHAAAEFRSDIEGTLDTVCGSPDYELHPLGWCIRDKALLREFYLEMFKVMRALEPVPGTDGSSTIMKSGEVIAEWVRALQHRDASGHVVRLNFTAIVVRDPETGLIKGEYAYLDNDTAELFARLIDPEVQARMTAA